ncbi:unnamed protein product [Rotaria socialis]|uniref:Carrier domain-containing protein n=1 Tax=Rotaria socialis TaxID=392032 RepID=A0A817MCG1_9BILA|nr:unnamed protein product [Rotaria socialis]CAF3300155.1 unnamed protein product [Rotaria socialis]CAF4240083.1 unnamed protein product [Rotaria socialis]CAF4464911.1 unnamed protein product [Rotaria socialis]
MIEYERYRLKLIDIQSPIARINDPLIINALAQYLVTIRYSNNIDEVVIRLDTSENQVQHLVWHYEMLQEYESEDESKAEEVCIIPQRDANENPFRLCVPSSRFLADLTWVRDEIQKEIKPSMVEVRIHCVGINFRDVLKARGLYPHTRAFAQADEDQPHVNRDTEPGSDFVGTVLRASPNVDFQPGDHVVGISAHGTLHSNVVLDASQIVRIPSECPLTDEQLSVMPTVCLTVIYSLRYRVHLRRGQTVLIHAATGGAGQICIQYCQWLGARVLATAGTEEKRRFLREQCGVEHVFKSRDASFVNCVRNLLPNGVDVIINSLSGSLLKESVKLLAYHGHFVEWGKRDVFDRTQLSMFDFRSDCSFHVIDLISLSDKQQDICTVMLKEMVDLFVLGKLRAIQPTVVFEPSQVVEAFMRFVSGQAMGKSVVRMTNSDQPLYLSDKQLNKLIKDNNIMFVPEVCEKGTILISGGFGGLGLTMSRWMIEKRGVKRVMLMSRRTLAELEQPDNPQYEEWLRLKQTVSHYNGQVDVVKADVTNFEQVRELMARLAQTPYPVRGIIHSAVVAEDRSLVNLSVEHLNRVLAAKIRGAWVLHQATQDTNAPIHFFAMFSSIRNHLLELAAAGYNAGNEFLDALAHYRMTRLNLPALSVSLPAVSGAGMFHRYRDLLISLQVTQGFELVPTIAVFELIERFHINQNTCPCPVIFAANWQTLYQNRNKLPTFYLTNIVKQRYTSMKLASMSGNSSNAHNTADSHLSRRETIIEQTQAAVARLLGTTNVERISVDRSLVSQGMDSLAALSLYNWLGKETSIFVPLVDLLQGISIETIATVVHNKLKERQQVVVSTNKEDDMEISVENEKNIELSNSSTYTGTDNIVCLQRPFQKNCPIIFYITDESTTNADILSKINSNKISDKQNKASSGAIYAVEVSSMAKATNTSTYVRDLITQMRRIQPRGLYQLVTGRNHPGETIANEMLEQFKDYSAVTGAQLRLVDI